MEAVPRMPMLFFDLKTSPESVDFKVLKEYIQLAYHEDPETYSLEIHNLEALRAQAVHPQHNVDGVNFLKKYFSQLTFLKTRFPITREGPVRLTFTWKEAFSSTVGSSHDVRFELLCVMFNIGSLHSKLGVMDERVTSEGLKLACSHFQCAAWAFQQLKEINCPDVQMSSAFISFLVNTCLAQAQECVLEQSLTGNRKSIINAKVSAQIVDFYSISLNAISSISSEQLNETNFAEVFDNKTHEGWKRYLRLKIDYYRAITLLYLGMQSEDEQKMGERVTYYEAAFEKLTESMNGTKSMMKSDVTRNLHDLSMMSEAFSFTMDVIEGKRKAARNDNEFVYHEKVPALESLPELKGRDLVRCIPFSPNDPDISGPDIFEKLIPMKAHEAASLYSEEKAKLLRRMSGKVDCSDEELTKFMSSLQLDIIGACHNEERLPEDLIDKCAEMSARPNAIQELTDAMSQLSDNYHEVDAMLEEIKGLVLEEEESEKEYQEIMGPRPPSIVATDLKREMNKYFEAHKKAQESNDTLQKVMSFHIANLKLLSLTPAELEKHIPPLTEIKTAESEKQVEVVSHLVSKVEEMRQQRATLLSQLRTDLHSDEITRTLVTRPNEDLETVFESALAKHNIVTNLIETNLQAQPRILAALTSAYTACAPVRTSLAEVIQRRNSVLAALRASHDAYEDLKAKTKRGNEFYEKLGNSVSKLLTRVKGTCNVQDEERLSLLKKENKVLPRHKKKAAASATKAPSGDFPNPHSGPKLKDYLAAGGGYAKTPQRYSTNYPSDFVYPTVPSGVRPTPVGSEMNVEMKTDSTTTFPYDQVTPGLDKAYTYPAVSSYPAGYAQGSTGINPQDKTYNSQYPVSYATNPSYPSDNAYYVPTTFTGSNPYYGSTGQQLQPYRTTQQYNSSYGTTPQAIEGSSQSSVTTNSSYGNPYQAAGGNTQIYPQQPGTQNYGAIQPESPLSPNQQSISGHPNILPEPQGVHNQQTFPNSQYTTQPSTISQYPSQQAMSNSQYASEPVASHPYGAPSQSVPSSVPSSFANTAFSSDSNAYSQVTPTSQYTSQTAASSQYISEQVTPSTVASYVQTPQANAVSTITSLPYSAQPTYSEQTNTAAYSSVGLNPQGLYSPYQTSSTPVTNPAYVHSSSQPSVHSYSSSGYPNPASTDTHPNAPGPVYPNTGNSTSYPNVPSSASYPNTGYAAGYPKTGNPASYTHAGNSTTYPTTGNYATYPNATSPATYPNVGNAASYPHTASPVPQYPFQNTGDSYSQYPNTASNSSQFNSSAQNPGQSYDQSSQYGNVSIAGQYAYGNTGTFQACGSTEITSQGQYGSTSSQYGASQYGTGSSLPQASLTPQSSYGNSLEQFSNSAYGQSYISTTSVSLSGSTSVSVNPQTSLPSAATTAVASLPQNIPSAYPSSFSPYTPDPKYPSSPSSYNSSYSNAGHPSYLQTQSSTYSPHETAASSSTYYNAPYGTQSYMQANGNSYVNTTPSSLMSPDVTSPTGTHPAYSSIQPSSQYNTSANSSQYNMSMNSSQSATKSNVDLLADLDINITQSALIPSSSPTTIPASSSTSQILASSSTSQIPALSSTSQIPLSSSGSQISLTNQLSGQMSSLSLGSGSRQDDKGVVISDPEMKASREELPSVLSQSSFTAPKPIPPELSLDKETLTLLAQDVESLEKIVDSLMSRSLSGPAPLDIKWKELNDLQAKEAGLQNISVARCYPMKNRSPDILPYDSTRVELPSTKDDYINASYIRCSSIPNSTPLIVTQAPVPATVADFWTMIWEKSVELVVCLLPDAELDSPAYWPNERGQDLDLAKLRISLQSRNLRGAWTERILSLQDQEKKLTRVVIHIQMASWPGSSFPSSPAQFVSVVTESITLYRQQRSLAHPIVVHCSAGIGRSGLYCLVLLAITQIQSGKPIPDLVNLAANISACRKNVLRDREHLKFSHQCVLYYAQDLLIKRGLLSRTSMDEKRPKTHSRIPSQDFIHSGGASNVAYSDFSGLDDQSSSKKGHSRKSSSSSICSSSNKAEMFSSQVGALDKLSTLSTPQDPLSQIDPLWPIKKEKEPNI